MSIALDTIPRFGIHDALETAGREYGLEGPLEPLPSERDQNFLIRDPVRGKFVLKIANRGDPAALLEFQHEAMRRVAAAVPGCRVQALLPTRAGAEMTVMLDPSSGARHLVRVLRWIDGEVLAASGTRTPALFRSIGECMARIDAALAGFRHPAMHRVLQWDLRHAGLAREKAALLPPARRAQVERVFDEWQRIDWTALPHAVIHGDANDHNVLLEAGVMSGILDFGDMTYTAMVCEPAIALAYALFNQPDPFAAAAALIGGYHRHRPLAQAEQRALFPLVRARLAASVCYSAHNRARNPGDAYQVISEAAAWALLERLDASGPGAALEAVRAGLAV